MLSPAEKPQADGSDAPLEPVVVPLLHDEEVPVETGTVEPHCVKAELDEFLYIEYCTVPVPLLGPLSVRPIKEVWPDANELKVLGSW